MTPSVASGARYQITGGVTGAGSVLFGCQVPQTGVFCYGPDQIRAAYGIQSVLNSGITGKGRTIVIVDAYQSPVIRQDLALFDSTWGIPAPKKFNIIAPDGLTPFDPNDGNQVGWSAEISLDVEWAHVIAPGAAIDLVLAKSSQDADILSATRYAVDHNLGDVISQSFGEAEICMDPTVLRAQHELFKEATEKGIALFASAGDNGSAQPNCDNSALILSASTPASDPAVTGVGGTSLLADAHSGAYGSESVWNDEFGAGGGGYSTIYPRPSYQKGFNTRAARGVPDIAYNGDVRGGVIVAWSVLFPNAFWIFGGTSAGSPQWAGIDALLNQMNHGRLGALNRTLYDIGKSESAGDAFHDITVGNNAFGGVPGYAAGPGWDAATGLGTPKVDGLLPLLISMADEQGNSEGGG